MADHKPVRRPSFVASKSVDTQWKGSFFEQLFPLRKALFEKFPSANKGLDIKGPGIKLGSEGAFSFSSNEKNDKVEYKEKSLAFLARYKKDAKLFDVTLKQPFPDDYVKGLYYILRYEERKEASPHYLIGYEFQPEGAKWFKTNGKINPVTTRWKGSVVCKSEGTQIPSGIVFAKDWKLFLNQLNNFDHIQFNVGASYENPLGTSSVAANHNGHVTLTHTKKHDKLTVGVEATKPVLDKKPAPTQTLAVAAIYQCSPSFQVKGKLSKDLHLNVAVKKDFSKNVSVIAGTNLDLKGDPTKPPAFGFKVTAKA